MKIISKSLLKKIPASHENLQNPGVLKQTLFTHFDFPYKHRLQMVNWAYLQGKRSFRKHYHQEMAEIFIIVQGRAKIIVNGQEKKLKKGDSVLIPIGSVHQMINIGRSIVEYIVIGVSLGKGGKTIEAE